MELSPLIAHSLCPPIPSPSNLHSVGMPLTSSATVTAPGSKVWTSSLANIRYTTASTLVDRPKYCREGGGSQRNITPSLPPALYLPVCPRSHQAPYPSLPPAPPHLLVVPAEPKVDAVVLVQHRRDAVKAEAVKPAHVDVRRWRGGGRRREADDEEEKGGRRMMRAKAHILTP